MTMAKDQAESQSPAYNDPNQEEDGSNPNLFASVWLEAEVKVKDEIKDEPQQEKEKKKPVGQTMKKSNQQEKQAEPSTSSSPASSLQPQPTESLAERTKRKIKEKAAERKKIKSTITAMQKKKQVDRYLLPDAPPLKKQKREASPNRVLTPTPRILQASKKQSISDEREKPTASGSRRHYDVSTSPSSEVETSPAPGSYIFPPDNGIVHSEFIVPDTQIVKEDIEYLGLTPSMSNWRTDEGSNDEKEESIKEEMSYHESDLGDDEDEQADSHRSWSPSESSLSSESAFSPVPGNNEFGEPMDADEDSIYLAPDTHSLFEREGNRDECNRKRGRTSGRRGGRKRARGAVCSRGGYQKVDPLKEIWRNDEDVPPELLSLVKDTLRKRQSKLQNGVKVERIYEREDASESENDYEFLGASDDADTFPSLESKDVHFEWSSMETFRGVEEQFKPKRTGSVHYVNSGYDAFRAYWNDDILEHIASETNLYASKIASASFKAEWFPTNCHEILCLFSFWMMLGIVKMPTLASCFSVDPLLKTEVFRRIFTRRRYEMLSKALHFVDSTPNYPKFNTGARRLDRMHRLKPILTHLNSAFQSNYILSKDICIDDSLTLCKGELNLKQYIRNKASKFGIKTLELCESTTGYLWSFIVYSGKQSTTEKEQSPGSFKSTAVVKKLMGPLLNKGYRLFMDNWYNSPQLARYLKLNGTDCVGTLRSCCPDVPVLINKAPLHRGEYIARHSGDVTVLSWQDQKRKTMISTCHGSSVALPTVSSRPSARPVPFKPQIVLDYNKYMGGVDSKDQMMEPYLLERKRCRKWYMKLFKRLVNVSILNSRIVVQSSTQKDSGHLAFRLHLVDSILTKHLSLCPLSRKHTVTCVSSSKYMHEQPNIHIFSTHWPVLLEQTENSSANNRNFRKRCVVCLREGRKTQKTIYCCESCRVPLCIKDCFKSYHTS